MVETSNRPGRTVLAAVALGVGGYGIAVVVVTVTAFAFIAAGVPIMDRSALMLAISVVMGQGVAFGAVALGYLRVTGLDYDFIGARVPTLRDVGWIVGGLVALYLGLIVLSTLLTSLGIQSAQNQVTQIGQGNPDVFLMLIPLSFLVIGPGEELLYRGVVQARLRTAFGPVVAIGAASLIFAAIHVFSLLGQGKLATIAILFVLSLVFGVAYEYTGNLVVPATIHGAFNAAQFLVMYYATKQGIELTLAF